MVAVAEFAADTTATATEVMLGAGVKVAEVTAEEAVTASVTEDCWAGVLQVMAVGMMEAVV